MTPRARIGQGDCVERMRELRADSVQLIVTSPPYDDARTYNGHCDWDFQAAAKEIYRVMVIGGIVCWNVGDMMIDGSKTLTSYKQAIFFKEQCGFKVHDTIIYEKSNGSKPTHTRYNQLFEYVFILSKGKPRCFNPIKDKKNVTAGKSVFGRHTIRQKDGSMKLRNLKLIAAEYGMRGNVWRGNTRGQEDVCQYLPHPAMMPKWLAHDLILSFSNNGDTVLDPFAGSGTTGKMAIGLNRNCILFEKNPEYIPIIEAETNVTPGLAF